MANAEERGTPQPFKKPLINKRRRGGRGVFRRTENEFALRADLIGLTVSQDEAKKEGKRLELLMLEEKKNRWKMKQNR